MSKCIYCRVGIANFITLLAQKVNASIRPFTSTLVKLLFHAVIEEKSGLAKRAFASASAIILKYAGPALAQKIIEDTASLHSGDRNSQLSCGILFKNYSSFASDLIGGYQATVLPVSFISRLFQVNFIFLHCYLLSLISYLKLEH